MRAILVLAVTMTVALVGCKKKPPAPPDSAPAPASPGASGSGGGSNDGGITAAGGMGIVINPSAALGGGGGGGAVQAVRKAARRADAMNELKNLGEIIEGMRDPIGRMPTKEQILAELKQAPKLLTAIQEGSFILTGTTEGGGLWAYEVDADTKPGLALIGGRATRSTPEELQPYFAQMPKPVVPPAGGPPQPAGGPAQAPKQPAPPGRGAQAPAAPGTFAVVGKKDMEDIRTFIDTASINGQMPSPDLVKAALMQSESPASALVQQKAIILTGAKARESVWAYEAAAVQRGGLIVTQNGVETVTADDLKRRLAAN